MSYSVQKPDPGRMPPRQIDPYLVDPDRLVFIGGLHRSGTTLLGRILADHPDMSGFSGTGATEDEGQHLQTVYLPARKHGGPGRFARSRGAHLTAVPRETSHRLGTQLLHDWAPYWDLSKTYLIEKSPPNVIMGQYLQSIFPGSALIVIVRHPVIVALATRKWTGRTSLVTLVEHWFLTHRLLADDAQHHYRFLLLRYEDLVASPDPTLARVQSFLGVESQFASDRLLLTRSDPYLAIWDAMSAGHVLDRRRRVAIERRFGAEAEAFGYHIDDPAITDPWDSTPMSRLGGQPSNP